MINTNAINWFARVGFAARAAVYLLMGSFALMLVLGFEGTLTDGEGSLRKLLAQPFGTTFLVLLGIGLFAYAIWRALQSVLDLDHRGTDAKSILVRTAHFIGGFNHAVLGYYALNLILHLSATDGTGGEGDLAQWLLSQPFGQMLTGALALVIAGIGIGQVYIAVSEKFLKRLELPAGKRQWLSRVCKFGLISRGVSFVIVGWMFMRAALYANSREAQGVKGVWAFLVDQPFGRGLALIMALGLLAFAVYGLAEALYRKSS